jgi:ribosome-associated protein
MNGSALPHDSYEYRFMQASGPGGQHVNKTSTAVELRVQLDAVGLNQEVLRRLREQNGNRINKSGELVVQAEAHRSQLQNKKDAMDRVLAMIEQATVRPKSRIPTKPSNAAKKKRMHNKKARGETKNRRRRPKTTE